jgi:hypothetical protein
LKEQIRSELTSKYEKEYKLKENEEIRRKEMEI